MTRPQILIDQAIDDVVGRPTPFIDKVRNNERRPR
jgi:hypothetical protein